MCFACNTTEESRRLSASAYKAGGVGGEGAAVVAIVVAVIFMVAGFEWRLKWSFWWGKGGVGLLPFQRGVGGKGD